MKKRVVEFYRHSMDDECVAELSATAKGLFLTTGPKTAEFEKKFSSYLGLPFSIGTMSCTHAMHLAYIVFGIGEGDEVIVPAYTFVATITAVMHAGATPVLVDVDSKTGLIDPGKVEEAITPKTKAICPVHLYGVMAPMLHLSEIAKKHNLKILEDAAHCVEGRGPGFGPGTHSDAAAFSFYATKNITCGEGGALATRHKDFDEAIRRLRLHGMDQSALDRFKAKVAAYDVKQVGYKANLNDLLASLLIPQLAKIEERLAKRNKIACKFDEGLKGIDGVSTPVIPEGFKSARHLYTIRITPAEKRDDFIAMLIDEGVNCSINFRPLSCLSFMRENLGMKEEEYPNATGIGNSTITLPFYPLLEEDEVDYIVDVVRKTASRIL